VTSQSILHNWSTFPVCSIPMRTLERFDLFLKPHAGAFKVTKTSRAMPCCKLNCVYWIHWFSRPIYGSDGILRDHALCAHAASCSSSSSSNNGSNKKTYCCWIWVRCGGRRGMKERSRISLRVTCLSAQELYRLSTTHGEISFPLRVAVIAIELLLITASLMKDHLPACMALC